VREKKREFLHSNEYIRIDLTEAGRQILIN